MSVVPRLVAFPMHGESKLRREGLRTRDAHLLQWLAARGSEIDIISRPEPWPRTTLARQRRSTPLPDRWHLVSKQVLFPSVGLLRDRRRWWVESVRWLPQAEPDVPVIGWNPFAVAAAFDSRRRGQVLFDLLDDWTVHPAFSGISREVDAAYRTAFDRADTVTANSEGTIALAGRYGRDDATLIPNGVDPERFDIPSAATGTRTVIGYGGKIGHRLDLPLIHAASQHMKDCVFEFAGPVLDRPVGRALKRLSNIRLLGDVHYDDYPRIVSGWDVGWIPHAVGMGEVGGDVIKAYEYRAAGLPTFSTPIIGAGRAEGVHVLGPTDIIEALASLVRGGDTRIPRQPSVTPEEHTWKYKAGWISELLCNRRVIPSAGDAPGP